MFFFCITKKKIVDASKTYKRNRVKSATDGKNQIYWIISHSSTCMLLSLLCVWCANITQTPVHAQPASAVFRLWHARSSTSKLSAFPTRTGVSIYMLNDSGLMLATELIRRTRPIILRSMSSRDFPCVSGTYTMTKKRPMTQIEPNIQNAP